jgi:hypothetical protein
MMADCSIDRGNAHIFDESTKGHEGHEGTRVGYFSCRLVDLVGELFGEEFSDGDNGNANVVAHVEKMLIT